MSASDVEKPPMSVSSLDVRLDISTGCHNTPEHITPHTMNV